MKGTAITALILGALIAAPAGAAAHQRRHRRLDRRERLTFSGSCALAGTVEFRPAMTDTPQPVRDVADATGTCSGAVRDRRGRTHRLNSAQVRYLAQDTASNVTCALSAGAVGTGTLVLPWGKLRFALSETRLAAVAELSLTGARGGSAVGTANINANADPAQILEACVGPGLSKAPVDIHIQSTPAISG